MNRFDCARGVLHLKMISNSHLPTTRSENVTLENSKNFTRGREKESRIVRGAHFHKQSVKISSESIKCKLVRTMEI